jgi:hypothetical protein
VILTNATYSANSDTFVPLTGIFERTPGTTNLHIPHWQLNVRTRLRFAMVDISLSPNRIVDYVNLDSTETPLDITDALMHDTPAAYACAPNSTLFTPSSSRGGMWCTNRLQGLTADNVLTFGVQNQIEASLGHTLPDWNGSYNAFPPGMTKDKAIAFFLGQFTPGYLAQSNTFSAPFQPFRNIYLLTTWQANDPLVHYTLSDLLDPFSTNRFQLDNTTQPLTSILGRINMRYQPWGGNPEIGAVTAPRYALNVKDPVASALGTSDSWDFPTNPMPNLTWLGRVHRGTPWQTIYLKAPGTDLTTWTRWTGDTQLVTNWNGVNRVTPDAFFTQPTNDWRLASLLVSLLSTNDPRQLASVNQPDVPAWCGLLDGMAVLTNSTPDELDPVIMSSTSPQAATIAAALDATRAGLPGQRFHDPGELLATPELSVASPWLNTNSVSQSGITDEAYEAIPAQLLLLLRPDSVGSASWGDGTLRIQFTGSDGYAYAVQTSSNLLDWLAVRTNYPTNGSFDFPELPPPGSPSRFYRSVLLP